MPSVISATSTAPTVTAAAQPRRPVSRLRRFIPAIARRLRLIYVRLRYPSVRFGRDCTFRAGLHLLAFPSAQITIGDGCIFDRETTIEASGNLSIGDRVIFGHHCTIGVEESVTIGSDCLIAEMVSIRDHDHRFDRIDIPTRDQGSVSKPVTIGRNVWLGAKVTVVRGVTIGDNAVIGANAVVTRDIPANSIAVGIPAKVIRFRTA